MAAVTAVAVAGAGALMSSYSMAAQGNSEEISANYNAMVNEQNARRAMEQAREDEKQFRLSVRREQGANIAAISASGIILEGSPIEVLRDNARKASEDAIQIRMGGISQRDTHLQEAQFSRNSGASRQRAANIGAAASFLQGAGNAAGKL